MSTGDLSSLLSGSLGAITSIRWQKGCGFRRCGCSDRPIGMVIVRTWLTGFRRGRSMRADISRSRHRHPMAANALISAYEDVCDQQSLRAVPVAGCRGHLGDRPRRRADLLPHRPLYSRTDLGRLRTELRGVDPEVDAQLMALHVARLRWRTSASGSEAAPAPGSAVEPEQLVVRAMPGSYHQVAVIARARRTRFHAAESC